MDAKYYIVICLLCSPSICFAQSKEDKEFIRSTDKFIPEMLAPHEFIYYQLPPLDTLFEGAKTNPRLQAIGASIEAARHDLKTTKRDWLQYFSVKAGYTRGILGTYTDRETQDIPLTTIYSGATQNSWLVGANIVIPINKLFSHGSNIKKQKEIIKNVKYQQQIQFDEIKSEIIELYCNIQYQLKLLKLATESITLYNAEYKAMELDYINNNHKDKSLSNLKHAQKMAQIEYEKIINELNIMFLKLELISNISFRNKSL